MGVYLDISELPEEGGGGFTWIYLGYQGKVGYTWIYLGYQGKVRVYLDISELPGEGGGLPGYIWATRGRWAGTRVE